MANINRSGALRLGFVAAAVLSSACRAPVDNHTAADAPVQARQSALTTLTRTGWVATGSSTSGSNVAANAIDGSATTRWSTTGAQTGQSFTVDMLSPQIFSEVTLDAGTTTTNFPRGYQLNVSNDGSTWTAVTTGTGTTALVTITFATQTARFIRINQTATNGTMWSIQELNVFGPVLSRTGWVATASSTGSTNVAANALDGSATTRWSSSGAQTGQSFQVDMQSTQTFNQLTLDAGTTTTNFPRGYQVFVSNDGTNWGTAIATGTGTTAFISITFPTQWARFFKINQTATNSTVWSIQELNVAGQPTTPITQPRTGWVATGSSTNGTNVAANALDGSTTTRWSTSGAQTGQSFQVDMLTARTFNQIVLDAGTTTNNFPRAYQVQISNNGTTFTTVTSGTGSAALVTINFPAQTARYIKINQTATNTTTWSIQEMTVSGQALSPKGWLPTATSTGSTDVPANALDGVATTRWSTAVAQANGQTFQVDMVTAQTFNQLTLDAGTSTGNFPRGYAVSVSNDGTNWGTPVATGTGSSQLVTINFLTKTARFFKIVQTGTATNVWSIHELNVWRTVQPCDTVTCTAPDVCHVAGVCDPNVGTCSTPAVVANPTTVTCSDGNACTTTDRCTATGSCAGVPVVCTAPDVCHTAGTCTNGVCSSPTVVTNPTTVACDDGNACTTTDRCTATGSCAGVAVVCTAQDTCHTAGTCTNGVCSNPMKTDGISCNDSNACTTGETCQTGVCSGGHAQTCSGSGNASTMAVGSGGGSVTLEAVTVTFPSGVFTSATNVTITSTTNAPPAGMTAYTPIYRFDPDGAQFSAAATVTFVVGTALTNPVIVWSHPGGGWDEIGGTYANGQISATVTHFSQGFVALGQCVGQADGATCTDGNVCTVGDSCHSGLCQAGTTALGVDDSNTCTIDSCNATTGAVHTPVTDGTTCNDNKVCTLNDSCHAGVCTGTLSPACMPPPALSLPDIVAAKQQGLMPNVYLTPTLFQPMGTAPYDPTDPLSGTEAWAVNDAGTTVGYSEGMNAEFNGGQMAYAFVADSAGERLLTPYWPGGPTYPMAINQAGWIGGFGGPIAQTNTAQDWSRIVIYPPGASPQPIAPPLPVPIWLGSPIRFWTQAIDNVIGSAGLPTLTGYSTYTFGGTKDVWHLDNSVAAAVGPHSLSGLPASPEWTTGHLGGALHMNGSVCLSTPVASGTLPYVQPGITMMAWVKPDAAMCPGGRRTILARTTDYALTLACKADNSAAALTGQTWIGSFWNPTPAGTVPFGQWSHVALTWDYHTMRAFVNGVLVSELTSPGTAVGNYQQTVSVGCMPGTPAMNFVGALDEISTFDVPMGADQINLYMNGTTDYRASSQYHDVARYKDGFFDIVLGPSDPIYTGSVDPLNANDLGMVVGAAFLAGGGTSAVFYDPQKGWTDFNSLIPPDSNWNLQAATGVDETGRFFIGYGSYYGMWSAWRFDSLAGEIVNLGNVPFNYTYPDQKLPIIPRSINSRGHVAGAVMDQSNFWSEFAFVYTDETGLFPLNDLIDPAQQVTLRDAKQIDDNDDIAGISWRADNTSRRGFKLSVPPLPSTVQVATLACFGQADGVSCANAPNSCGNNVCNFGVCGGDSEHICLRADGVVDTGDGQHFIAVFGYDSSDTVTVKPDVNNLLINNAVVSSPQSPPPVWFSPGTHPGFYLPTFTSGQTISWRVDGQLVTLSAASPHLAHVPVTGGGYGVQAGGATITIQSNMDPFRTPPAEPALANDPPVGSAYNGSLQGTFGVTASGAATYTLPIMIPPGVNGMAPNLSLVYNSQGGDGVAGQGFDLAGLSIIHRCPRTKIEDGQARPVLMDNGPFVGGDIEPPTDGICLDGQRLFEQNTIDGTYRTEKKDFSTIRYDPAGFFSVTTKTGETRYYGLSANARVTAQGLASDGTTVTTGTAIWALERVVDAWGNYFDVHYNEDHADFTATGLRVSKIEYTHKFNASGGTLPGVVNSVSFTYDPSPSLGASATRQDVRWTRFGLTRIPRNRRLLSIDSPRGTYSLIYASSSSPDVSRLQTVRYCAGGTCMDDMTFQWQTSGQNWPSAPAGYVIPSAFPSGKGLSGSQIIDLDGDGRSDLVLARTSNGTLQSLSWQNSGQGWSRNTHFDLPVPLTDKDDKPLGVRFADIDGDGVLDLIADSVDLQCLQETQSTGTITTVCSFCGSSCSDPTTHYSPAVWLNKIPQGGTWTFAPEYNGSKLGGINFNATLHKDHFSDTILDMNNDGKADIVRLQKIFPSESTVFVVVKTLLNAGAGVGWSTAAAPHDVQLDEFAGLHLRDVNRDGLPDVLSQDSFGANQTVFINQGPASTGDISFSAAINRTGGSGGSFGDIDGDGLFDGVIYEQNTNSSTLAYSAGVGLGDGAGMTFGAAVQPYVDTLGRFSPTPGDVLSEDFAFALVDINGDGLVDLVRNHANRFNNVTSVWPQLGGGEVLFNNGTNWVSPTVNTGWVVPAPGVYVPAVVPSSITTEYGGAFVDLDGDGTVDVIQEEMGPFSRFGRGAWLNGFKAPLIKQFPRGLATPDVVTYVSITEGAAKPAGSTCAGLQTTAVYCDDDAVDAGTRRMAMPVQVVSKVRREDGSGVGTHADTNYAYHSLRVDPDGRGPLGFHRVIASDQASGVTTQTTYGQAYPYTGAPTKVERYQMINGTSFQLSSTTTNYCDSFITDQAGNPICSQPGTKYGPLTSLFVYPYNVDDQAYLHPETNDKTNMIETVTNFRYDPFGNATKISTTTTKTEAQQTEVITTEIDNDYGMGNSQEQLQGRITETRATNTGGGRTNHHKTDYIYQPVSTFGGLSTTALTLLKKQVELGSAWPLELHTAYGYDQFGNTTLTTNCANDFSQCSAGASGPANTGDPFHHPPFRTVSVTYDLQGLFPTHTTNAVGHTDSTTFDPFKGVLLQRIDPNGGINCYTYDTIGRQTSVTERCGSDNPIETTTQYFLISTSVVAGGGDIPQTVVAPGTPPNSRTITVTRPATGQATWTFADDQGKAAGTVTRSFDGGLIETRSQYTALGQVAFVAKPFELQSFADSTVIPYGQTTTYDDFKRVFQVTDELGLLDAAGVPRTLMTQTTYNGSSLTASTTVNGMPETKTQTKNALGKLASIVDNNGKKISYTYDAEGNLLTTTDQAGNVVQLDYDTRGRKSLAVDPDLGQWTYTADGFGDIVSQTDGKGQTVTMMYDPLARMIIRANSTNPADAAEWIYDVAPGAGKGKLAFQISASDPKFTGACPITSRAQVAGGLRAVKSFAYTPFGDVQEVSDCADGATFMTSYEYDSLGRQSVIKYPAVSGPQLTIWSHYTRAGFLHYLTEDAPSEPGLLWQAKAYSPLGQVTDEQARNGVETVANRNAVSGWILGSTSTAHADAGTVIQNSSFTYDEAGDLLTRTRSDQVNDAASSESFTYDGLNRIMTSHVDVNALNYHAADTYGYDDLGNLNNKGGNSYGYGTGCLAGSRFAGPHAVCTDHTGGTPFVYDGNGNMTAGKGRTIQYNFENKPVHIQSPGGSIDFMYGADGNRVVQLVASGSTTSRTVYVGLGGTGKSMYERTTGSDGSIQHVYFIYAGAAHGGNAFAVRVLNGTTTADRYFSFDHLGSTTAVSDEKGHIGSASGPDANVLGYDAWGARRNPDGTTTAGATFNQQPGHREFTGHEAIPDVGLVNMNGRVYDPVLGRFLSPDPNVQNLSDLQTYNRYSYVLNNPLRYTDPTGYFWSEIGTFFKNYFSNPFNDLELLGGIVVCATSAGAGCIVMGLMMTAMNTAIAIDSGAPVDQSLLNAAVGVSIGFLTGGAVSAAGGGPLSQIIAGGASAALATGISNSISHKDFLGYNMLGAALASAATGAVTYGLKQVTALSQAGGKYLKEDPDTGPGWYKLNKQGLSALKPVFDQYGYDVEDVRVHIGDSVVNLGGYQRTLGDSVYINGSSWQRLSDDEQLFTLGHEITHSAQWNEGHVTFAGRYLYEEVKFGQYDQYNVPSSLKSMSVGSFDLRNSNYTLDEIADRIGYEVAPKATSMYQVKPLSAYGF